MQLAKKLSQFKDFFGLFHLPETSEFITDNQSSQNGKYSPQADNPATMTGDKSRQFGFWLRIVTDC